MIEKYLNDTYQVLEDISTMKPYGGVGRPSKVYILIFLQNVIFLQEFHDKYKKIYNDAPTAVERQISLINEYGFSQPCARLITDS